MTAPATRAGARRGFGQRVLRATLGIAAVTAGLRLLGLLKAQAIAGIFGPGAELDAYVLAQALPTFGIGVLANALGTALVPLIRHTEQAEGRAGTLRVQRELLGWMWIVLSGMTALLLALWPLYLRAAGAEFSGAQRGLSTELFHILAPGLLLHGVASFWAATLQAEKRFLLSVIAPGPIPIAIAVGALAFGREHGTQALAWGHLLGVGLEFGFLALVAGRLGLPLLPGRPRVTPAVRTFLRQGLPVLFGSLLLRSAVLVDQSMAAWLPAGSLSILDFAYVVVSGLTAVAVGALGTALLPFFSDLAAAGQYDAMRFQLKRFAWRVTLGGGLAAGLLYLGSAPLAALLYERMAFDAEDVSEVGRVMALFGLQLPFFAVGSVFARVLASLQANAVFLTIAAAVLPLNVILNLLLMPHLGVGGIALSTSLVYLTSSSALGLAAFRRLSSAART